MFGVDAVNGGAGMRSFVVEQLFEISHYTGTYMPLSAKKVLEKFWGSGEMRWDACFDRPYAFATLMGVDVSQLD